MTLMLKKYQSLKKSHITLKIHSNTLLDTMMMMMMLLDYYA